MGLVGGGVGLFGTGAVLVGGGARRVEGGAVLTGRDVSHDILEMDDDVESINHTSQVHPHPKQTLTSHSYTRYIIPTSCFFILFGEWV